MTKEKEKNKNAVALGRLSAKSREGVTNYSELGKRSWAKLTPEEKKARIDKIHKARKVKKLSTV